MFSIAAAMAAMLPTAAAAELPTYDLMGFPITPVQLQVVGSAHVREQSPIPTLMLGGMPASPHQVAVLAPRPGRTEEATTAKLTKAASPVP